MTIHSHAHKLGLLRCGRGLRVAMARLLWQFAAEVIEAVVERKISRIFFSFVC